MPRPNHNPILSDRRGGSSCKQQGPARSWCLWALFVCERGHLFPAWLVAGSSAAGSFTCSQEKGVRGDPQKAGPGHRLLAH